MDPSSNQEKKVCYCLKEFNEYLVDLKLSSRHEVILEPRPLMLELQSSLAWSCLSCKAIPKIIFSETGYKTSILVYYVRASNHIRIYKLPCAPRSEDYFPCPTQNYSKIGYFSKNMDNLRFNSHIFHNNPFLIINNYFDCTYSIIEQKKRTSNWATNASPAVLIHM